QGTSELVRKWGEHPGLAAALQQYAARSGRPRATVARPAARAITVESRLQTLGGKSWALVVGIDSYRDAPALNYAVADANAIASVLPGLGFEDVRVLLDADATKANIERAIYVDLKSKMQPDDRLFVFFAGHGITVK